MEKFECSLCIGMLEFQCEIYAATEADAKHQFLGKIYKGEIKCTPLGHTLHKVISSIIVLKGKE